MSCFFPGLKSRYIRQYGNAYELPSPNSAALMGLFHKTCAENGILSTPEDCFRYLGELPKRERQMSLFDENAGSGL